MQRRVHGHMTRIASAVSVGLLAVAISSLGVQPVQSQVKKESPAAKQKQRVPAKRPTRDTQKTKPRRKKSAAKPEDVTLTTKDGVQLHCTYYPGPETKQTVPMILVHDWEGRGKDLARVARWMQQSLNLSVIVPDLRGHGSSLRARGYSKPIDPSRFKGNAVSAMARDIEACKSFLLKKNNQGQVNIEQLGVLGTGLGRLLAIKWAVWDWSVRDLPTYKQGRDVKALILVSPNRSFRGATVNQQLKALPVWRNISTLTIVGSEDPRSLSEAKRVHKMFERAWGDRSDEAAPLFAAPTELQDTKLLLAASTGVDRWIATFINKRLAPLGRRFPWKDRTSPLQQ